MTRAVLIASLFLASCRSASGDDDLRQRVVDFCTAQATSLHVAVEASRRGSSFVVGFGDLAEHTTADSAFREFTFCVSVRSIDQAARDAALTEFQGAAQALSEHSRSTEESLTKMSSLYTRVNALPLR